MGISACCKLYISQLYEKEKNNTLDTLDQLDHDNNNNNYYSSETFLENSNTKSVNTSKMKLSNNENNVNM